VNQPAVAALFNRPPSLGSVLAVAGRMSTTGTLRYPQCRLSDAERAMLQGTWPIDLLEDPARQPRYVDSPHEFLRELLVGDHLEDFVILPNGTDLLEFGLEDCLPAEICESLKECQNVHDFITHLRDRPGVVDKYRADIEYVDSNRQQRDILRKEKLNLGKRIDEALRMTEEGVADPSALYVAELRQKVAAPHPIGGEKVKTVVNRDVKDVLGPYAPWTLYWDRYDEGVFVGGRRSGKGVHIDQVLWFNVARNWRGHKLVAAWPKGEVSKQIGETFYDTLLSPPLPEREIQALRKAAKVALLRPGDMYLFSGGIAHATLCVSDELCVCTYESIVSLHPVHVEHFLHTDDEEGPYCTSKYAMSSSELEETKDDMIDNLEDVADQLEDGGPSVVLPERVAPVPSSWASLIRCLHDDERLQASLREHYACTVKLCMNDVYLARNIGAKVLQAARDCGARKRRRLSPLPSKGFDSPQQVSLPPLCSQGA